MTLREKLERAGSPPDEQAAILRGLDLIQRVNALVMAGKPRPDALLEVAEGSNTQALVDAMDRAMQLKKQRLPFG